MAKMSRATLAIYPRLREDVILETEVRMFKRRVQGPAKLPTGDPGLCK
jgi:hypothetical protein